MNLLLFMTTVAWSANPPPSCDVTICAQYDVNYDDADAGFGDDSFFNTAAYGPDSFWTNSSTTYTITTPAGASVWNIANAVGHAMYRRSAGLTGETFEFFDQSYPSDTIGTGYHRDNDRVYVSSLGAKNKYMIVHEFGHLIAARAHWCGSSSCCDTASCAAVQRLRRTLRQLLFFC